MLMAVGIGIAVVSSAKYNVDSHRFGKYVVAVILGVYLLASETLRALYRVAAGWFNQRTTKDDEPD
jgi:surface polysaccharide O-acyltransferase-like enzyme